MADKTYDPEHLPSDAPTELKVAILYERLRGMREALDKQASEYERRLTELNHAHDKQVQDQATYVSSDRYEGWQGEINAWRGRISTDILSKSEYRQAHVALEQKIDSAQKLVWMGVGIAITMQIAIGVIVIIWRKG